MAATDQVLAQLRRDLEQIYGVEAATYIMDRPRGGWDSLATRDELRAEIAELRAEIHRELRSQTRWFASLVIAALSVVVAANGLMVALVRLG